MGIDERQFELSQYLDGDLSEEQRKRVEAELAADEDARKMLEDFRRIDGWAKAAVPPVPGIDWSKLSTRIVQRLPQRKPRRQRSVLRLAWWTGGALAAAAAVLIAVLALVQTPGPKTPTPRPGIELASVETVEGVTMDVPGLEDTLIEPRPERTHPTSEGSILIDVAGLETEAPPAEAAIVIAMSGSVESDVVVNSGPNGDGGWDPSMIDSPM